MAQSRLDLLLNAKNNTDPAFRAVQGNVKSLDSAAGTAAGGIVGLAKAIGAAGLVVLAQQALSAASAMAEQATSMRRAEAAALSLAGSQSKLNDLLVSYQKVTGGLSTTGEALIQIARLQAIGFADTTEELERFVTAARGAAGATGQNLDYIIGQLQLAIANQSTMRLDQLGLSVSEVNNKIAELTGGAEGLTKEAAYQEAILGTLVEKYGDIARSGVSAATGSEHLGTSLRQMSEDIASDVGPNIDRLAGQLADLIDTMNQARQDNGEAENLLGGGAGAQALVEFNNKVLDLGETWQNQAALFRANPLGGDLSQTRAAELAMADLGRQLVEAGTQYNNVAEIMGAPLMDLQQLALGNVAFEEMAQNVREVGIEAVTAGDRLQQMGIQAVAGLAQIQESQRLQLQRMAAIENAAQQAGRTFAENLGPGAGLARMAGATDELNSQVQFWQDMNFEMDDIVNVLLPAYTANMQTTDRALFDTTEQTKALRDAAKAAEAAFNDLKSKVSGVLSEALNVGVGVNPDDILAAAGLRPDAINENARRLADIAVNGFKDQDWLGAFEGAVPDLYQALINSGDPKLAAAQALKEFEAGLRPELIDKEAAKERVRQMLLGEQNLAELAQEIASELAAEMPNVGASGIQSIVSQALGIRGQDIGEGLAAGEQYAQGAVNAVSEAAPGTIMVQTLTAQLKLESNLALLRGAGSDAGNVWGTGFLTTVEGGVPMALIDMLVRLITPGISAGLNTQTTLVEAAP